MEDPGLADVIALEQRLLDPDVRRDPGRVAELLAVDYVEHGASGRVWDRQAILAALEQDPGVVGEGIDFTAAQLTEDVVLVTYRITGGRPSLRSSVWVRDAAEGWRLRFHQGTRVP